MPDFYTTFRDNVDSKADDSKTSNEPKPSYRKGPFTKVEIEEIRNIVQDFEKQLTAFGQRANKSFASVFSQCHLVFKCGRAPSIWNLFVKKWCLLNTRDKDESESAFRERFGVEFHSEVDKLSDDERQTYLNTLIAWDKSYQKHAAAKDDEAGLAFKYLLQAKIEYQDMARYWELNHGISSFGCTFSSIPGDVNAMAANSLWASSPELYKWLLEQKINFRWAMGEAGSVAMLQRAAEIRTTEFSKGELEHTFSTQTLTRNRVSEIIKDLLYEVTGMRPKLANWTDFNDLLIKHKKVVINWPETVSIVDADHSIMSKATDMKTLLSTYFENKRGEGIEANYIKLRDMTPLERSFSDVPSLASSWHAVALWEGLNSVTRSTVGEHLKLMAARKEAKRHADSLKENMNNSKLKKPEVEATGTEQVIVAAKPTRKKRKQPTGDAEPSTTNAADSSSKNARSVNTRAKRKAPPASSKDNTKAKRTKLDTVQVQKKRPLTTKRQVMPRVPVPALPKPRWIEPDSDDVDADAEQGDDGDSDSNSDGSSNGNGNGDNNGDDAVPKKTEALFLGTNDSDHEEISEHDVPPRDRHQLGGGGGGGSGDTTDLHHAPFVVDPNNPLAGAMNENPIGSISGMAVDTSNLMDTAEPSVDTHSVGGEPDMEGTTHHGDAHAANTVVPINFAPGDGYAAYPDAHHQVALQQVHNGNVPYGYAQGQFAHPQYPVDPNTPYPVHPNAYPIYPNGGYPIHPSGGYPNGGWPYNAGPGNMYY